MKGFMRKGAVIVAAGMLLTGCGDEMKTLTEAEEEIIINYSAGMVGKFNKRQLDGIAFVDSEEDTKAEEKAPEVPKDEDVSEENQNDKNTEDTKKPDSQEDSKQEVSLTEAIGISGVEAKYTGYEVMATYEESNYLSMEPAEGNTYFVVKYTITNTGSEEAVCDILSKHPVFTLKLNGTYSCKNEVTLLSNDLSTYTESLAPGASAEAVLIFEVPLEKTAEITSVHVNVQMNGVNGNAAI